MPVSDRPNNRRLYTMREACRFLRILGKIPTGTTKDEVWTLCEQYGIVRWSHRLNVHVVEEPDLYTFPDLRHTPGVAQRYGQPGGDPPPCTLCGGGFRRESRTLAAAPTMPLRIHAPIEEIALNTTCTYCGREGRSR